MDLINRAYIEVMTDGDASGRVFTFPIPTYNITQGLRLAQRERRPPVRDDRQVRAAVLPELPQLRDEPRRRPVDVLPPAAGPARAAQARQRAVRVGRADGLARRRDRQLRPARVPPRRATRTGCSRALDRLLDLARTSLELKRTVIAAATSTTGCSRTPGATSARSTTTSRRSASTASTRWSATSPATRYDLTDPAGHALVVRAARPRARPDGGVPGGDRPPVQPGGHAGGGHDVPVRQGGPRAGSPASCRPAPTTTRTTPTPRSCRWASPTTRSRRSSRQDELQTKYTGGTVLHLYMAERLSTPDACRELVRRALSSVPAAVPDGHADVLDLPAARLPGRRAPHVPARAPARARCGRG